jgi:hypothetical protein
VEGVGPGGSVSEGVATDQFFGNGRVPQMVQVLVVAVEDDRDTISAAREVLGVEWLMDITFFPRQLLRVPILSVSGVESRSYPKNALPTASSARAPSTPAPHPQPAPCGS